MSIEDSRAEIDLIDKELIRLLNMRARLAIKVGESKKTKGLSLCDREREHEILERICRFNTGPLDERAVIKLFRRIIYESRRIEARFVE